MIRWSLFQVFAVVVLLMPPAVARKSQPATPGWSSHFAAAVRSVGNGPGSLEKLLEQSQPALASSWQELWSRQLAGDADTASVSRLQTQGDDTLIFGQGGWRPKLVLKNPTTGLYQINGRSVQITASTTPEQLWRWLTQATGAPKPSLTQRQTLATMALAIGLSERALVCRDSRKLAQSCESLWLSAERARLELLLRRSAQMVGKEIRFKPSRKNNRQPASVDGLAASFRSHMASRLLSGDDPCSAQPKAKDEVADSLSRTRELRDDISEALKAVSGEEADRVLEDLNTIEAAARQMGEGTEMARGLQCSSQLDSALRSIEATGEPQAPNASSDILDVVDQIKAMQGLIKTRWPGSSAANDAPVGVGNPEGQ